MNPAELSLLITAKDMASGALRAFAGVLTSTVVGALADAARAGADEEASLIRMQTAVDNAKKHTADETAVLEEAVAVAKEYGSSTIEVNDSLALLVEQTGSVEEATRRLMVAEDLAHGAHIDLYTASKLLGKATDENTNVLSRYGIEVKKGADVTEMLAAVEERFGGQAEAFGNSQAGSIAMMTVAIDDWKASLGNALGQAQPYIALLPGLSAGFSLLGGAIAAMTVEQKASTAAGKEWLIVNGPMIVALALVAVAVEQVAETVFYVTDNWNKFIYALRNGKLDDIPVFGFFFQKAEMVLNALQKIKDAWDFVSGVFAGPSSGTAGASPDNGVPSFASGGIVPGPLGMPRLVIAHGGEPIGRSAGAGADTGGGITLNFDGAHIYGMADFEQQVGAAVRNIKQRGGFRGVLA
jgi:hypothetical protein